MSASNAELISQSVTLHEHTGVGTTHRLGNALEWTTHGIIVIIAPRAKGTRK